MYKLLAKVNKVLLPSFTKQQLDLEQAKKWQKALLAWRYYVTARALSISKKI
ncbi:SsrA-binding protein [Flavobacterium sp.]|uniref:SsrA-binding protein n=1 Tax=Flavobacterium sp. TaxID=239 RepID=UPI0025CE481C|nr:SsrA-binding protein [Flavobacterium sp.]